MSQFPCQGYISSRLFLVGIDYKVVALGVVEELEVALRALRDDVAGHLATVLLNGLLFGNRSV